MLDGFAGLLPARTRRAELEQQLNESAKRLAPLLEEREQLAAELTELPKLQEELKEKEKLLPGEDESKWARGQAIATDLVDTEQILEDVTTELADPQDEDGELARLFERAAPDLDESAFAEETILREWTATVEQALADIEILRKSLIARVVKMLEDAGKFSERWEEKRKAQEVRSRKRLAEAKITSPEEVLRRVGSFVRRFSVFRRSGSHVWKRSRGCSRGRCWTGHSPE